MLLMLRTEEEFVRNNWLAAFRAPFQPMVEKRLDQQGNPVLLLSADEFEGITDHKALFQMGKVRVRELNSIIGGMSGASDVTVEGVAEIVDGALRCHVIVEAEPVRNETWFGFGQVQASEPDGTLKPLPPSPAQEQYRVARLNEYIAEALAYTAGKPDFIDLYKALECLEAGEFVTKRDGVTKHFARTANAIFRHRTGEFELPNKPMTIEDARAHIRSLIEEASASVLAKYPLFGANGRLGR